MRIWVVKLLLSHHLRVSAGFDRVQVDAVSVVMLSAHQQDDLDIVSFANLFDGRRESLALGGARGAVVEVAVHVRDSVVDGHPHLGGCGQWHKPEWK